MKILFWFNGSGGQRRERKIVDFPHITETNIFLHEDEIFDKLENWKDSLGSNSEFQRWGWDEHFNETTREPKTLP